MRPRCRQIKGSTKLDAPLGFGGKVNQKNWTVEEDRWRRTISVASPREQEAGD
jgi:hypothetical protein